MKEKWEELLTVLGKMLSIYQAILFLSRQKYEILVAAKSQELGKVTEQEEILILQIGKLEEQREILVGELMAQHGIAEGKFSFEKLSKIAQPSVVEQLENLRKEFHNIMKEIEPLNKLNTELIKQALHFINYNINILSQTAVGPTYAPQGQSNEQAPKRTAFDARV